MSKTLNMSGGGAQEAPVISISSSGLITATAGDEKATKQLSTQGALTVEPGFSSQTVVTSGKYTTGSIVVNPIVIKSARVAANGTSGGTLTLVVPGLTSENTVTGIFGDGFVNNYLEYRFFGTIGANEDDLSWCSMFGYTSTPPSLTVTHSGDTVILSGGGWHVAEVEASIFVCYI